MEKNRRKTEIKHNLLNTEIAFMGSQITFNR